MFLAWGPVQLSVRVEIIIITRSRSGRIIHQLVGWDKETAIWWAGACELTFHFDWMLCWVTSPFPPAHDANTLCT